MREGFVSTFRVFDRFFLLKYKIFYQVIPIFLNPKRCVYCLNSLRPILQVESKPKNKSRCEQLVSIFKGDEYSQNGI